MGEIIMELIKNVTIKQITDTYKQLKKLEDTLYKLQAVFVKENCKFSAGEKVTLLSDHTIVDAYYWGADFNERKPGHIEYIFKYCQDNNNNFIPDGAYNKAVKANGEKIDIS